MNRVSISKIVAQDNWLNIAAIRPRYTVQHCVQRSAQHFLLDVATRLQDSVQRYAQYLIKYAKRTTGDFWISG